MQILAGNDLTEEISGNRRTTVNGDYGLNAGLSLSIGAGDTMEIVTGGHLFTTVGNDSFLNINGLSNTSVAKDMLVAIDGDMTVQCRNSVAS